MVDLSGNAIAHVDNESFAELKSLTHLYLIDNEISSVHPNSFANLKRHMSSGLHATSRKTKTK